MYYVCSMDIAFYLTGFIFRKTSNYQSLDCNQKDMSALTSSKIAYKYLLFFLLNESILLNLSFVIKREGWEIKKKFKSVWIFLSASNFMQKSYCKVEEQWISCVHYTIYSTKFKMFRCWKTTSQTLAL